MQSLMCKMPRPAAAIKTPPTIFVSVMILAVISEFAPVTKPAESLPIRKNDDIQMNTGTDVSEMPTP